MKSLLVSIPLCFALWVAGVWDKEVEVVEHETVEQVEDSASEEDLDSLARLLNSEAGGEGYDCQVMVANVVVNRMNYYNETLHQVISKPKQFSGFQNKRYHQEYPEELLVIAKEVLSGRLVVLPANVLFFCNPKMSTNKKFVKFCRENLHSECGNHIFSMKK